MLEKGERKIIEDVASFGWHLVMVMEDKRGPGFVYSVGMEHTLSHPEIIMFGLGLDLMATIINDMGREIRKGRNFSELGLFNGLIENYACKVIEVDAKWHPEYLGYAMWHARYRGRAGTLRVVQCLWPDKAGLFPDEVECHPEVKRLQPLLG